MSSIKRRQFLQFTGSALSAIVLSQVDLRQQAQRYGKVLAQETSGTKRALLVGINSYAEDPLQGCITDVVMQKELLMHRFGFAEENIIVLADDASISSIPPTRDNILQTFQSHLIQEASVDDVLVFHFSGHGSQVYDPQSGFEDGLNSTLVPIDRQVQQKDELTYVSDIMGKTLFLLMSQVPSDNLTVVLDCCYSGGGKRGNATVRAITGGEDHRRMEMEEALQQDLQQALGYSDIQLNKLRQQIAKGVVIASTQRYQLAADMIFDGFSAGAFTYALTQYLWQTTDDAPVNSVVANVSQTIKALSFTRQVPEVETNVKGGEEIQPAYFLEKETPPAEAVLKRLSDDEVQFWLGGVQPRALPAFAPGSTFTMLGRDRQPQGRVQLERREGLMGIGKLLPGEQVSTRSLPQRGLLMQEEVRAIPENLPLHIGMDESLSPEEQQSARTALLALGQLKPMALGTSQEIHYILGRMTPELRAQFRREGVAVLASLNSLGLYDEALKMVPGTFGVADESVEDAIARLRSNFQALLAARLLKLTLNADSARKKIAARMVVLNAAGNKAAIAAEQFTVRGGGRSLAEADASTGIDLAQVPRVNGIPQLPVGTQIRLELENQEDIPLYITVIVVTAKGELLLTFPVQWDATEEASKLEARSVRRLPDEKQGDKFIFKIAEPLGTAEVLVVASTWPLRDSLRVAQRQAAQDGTRGGELLPLTQPQELVDKLLADIDASSRRGQNASSRAATGTQQRLMDAAEIAAVSITFQAVDGPSNVL